MRLSLTNTTLVLAIVAILATFVPGLSGGDANWELLGMIGCGCGLLAVLAAFFVRGKVLGTLVILLALAAVVLAGPMVGFMLLFGLATGLGAFNAMLGSLVQGDMSGVEWQALALIGIGIAAALGFVSQAWAILRALKAWPKPQSDPQ